MKSFRRNSGVVFKWKYFTYPNQMTELLYRKIDVRFVVFRRRFCNVNHIDSAARKLFGHCGNLSRGNYQNKNFCIPDKL